MNRRVLVIGLDCAAPRWVFGPEAFPMPRLRALMDGGCWGRLRSCDPPITVPAWACMMSGRDPGELGIYGFRNRRDHSYDGMFTANASAITVPRVWDILSRAGKKVVVLGVPQTYPVKPVNGWLVSGFLAPDTNSEYTYPRNLKAELESECGGYIIDVKDFRTKDKDGLLQRIYDLMENRFAVARHLMASKPWDFFMMVEMGVDRLHHGFWKYGDPAHPRHEPGNPYQNVLRDYYQAVDQRIGELVDLAGGNTDVLIVSDHGAKSMYGGVRINQWLIQEGLLAVQDDLKEPKRFEDCTVDWPRTKAWASGGYYGRVFLNVQGREPEGVIAVQEYEAFRDELAARIEAMPGPDGKLLGNRALKPQELYRTVNGVAPDLFVYFGDLDWRSVGEVGGSEALYAKENDTGPDDANHDYDGIFILSGADAPRGEKNGLQLMDVAPTVLNACGVAIPEGMGGHIIR